MSEPPSERRKPDPQERPEGLERRASALLLLLLVLLVAAGVYLLYARGVFEPTQRLVLVADDSEGVVVGMDLTFSGFPIGRVSRIELSPQGNARILIDVPRRDARWLRQSSVFTMTRGLVGNTSLRAFSGVLDDPPLPGGAERRVLVGDATAEIPQLLGQVRELTANLSALTAADSALATTLAEAQKLSTRLNEPGGVLGVLLGGAEDTRKVSQALDRSNRLLARLDTLVGRTDGLVQRADGVLAEANTQVFGPQGISRDAQATVQQLQALLGDARNSLQRVDALLKDAQGTATQVRGATADLDVLRAEVDSSLRKVNSLVNEINRKWPFQREAEVKLP